MTLKDFLANGDHFAAENGCILKEVREGYARAEMTVTEHHLNAGGVCQGGAYFTLADIALAAVMNSRGTLTFGLENNIVFLKSAKVGDTLIAEASEVFNHHKIPYVDVRITNQHGDLCCVVTGIAYRKAADLPVSGLE
ncbi:MAG: hotdog fold thioesterase [Bacteroidaceae bacterium]|nr:hotdog fold thioesterase [Prevotella sp.]MBR1755439.1 hotdog fold thioesterase [Bacteroidaceae bacterium]